MIPPGDVSESAIGIRYVLFLEDDDDLRELFVLMVRTFLHRRCVGVGSYEEMVAMGDKALKCGAAILDINLGSNRRSGLDAYAWLRQRGYMGRIAFLTGHASSHPLVVEANRLGDAAIYTKPIEPERMRALVEGDDR